jgi:hypothetical protein
MSPRRERHRDQGQETLVPGEVNADEEDANTVLEAWAATDGAQEEGSQERLRGTPQRFFIMTKKNKVVTTTTLCFAWSSPM